MTKRKGRTAPEPEPPQQDSAITWRTEQRRIGDFVEWESNPRELTEKRAEDLRRSLQRFGYVEEIVLNADGKSMIGGHQRRRVLLAQAMLDPDALVDVRIPSRQLSQEEAAELAVRLNKNTGGWDFDTLANLFDEDELRAWGFTAFDLGKITWPEVKPPTPPPTEPGAEPAPPPPAQTRSLFAPVEVASLRDHPRNYREHPDDQVEQIIESIRRFGVFKNVVVARDGTILAGHGVVKAARKMGLEALPAIRLDLDPEDPRALKVLAGENEISKLASVDDRALTDMLKEILSADGLAGTGFSEQGLAALAMTTRTTKELRDSDDAAHWVGMPDYDPGVLQFKASVLFRTEEDRDAFLEKLGVKNVGRFQGGRLISLWYPEREETDAISVRYEQEQAQ